MFEDVDEPDSPQEEVSALCRAGLRDATLALRTLKAAVGETLEERLAVFSSVLGVPMHSRQLSEFDDEQFTIREQPRHPG